MGEALKSSLLKSSAALLFEAGLSDKPRLLKPSLLVVDFVATFILFLRGTKDGFTKDLFWRLCDKRELKMVLPKIALEIM
ncbi:hypothetical protein C2G38_2163827 [Gigaspora rosea]|uniref:Uncharacterized protein n=1 Tax=Gigaspora rosea TaxID=44941 RepID=A0A397W1U3_9GLOM|nr:hypothetical protein C2G38_2163827 [Gigaspora rosea]